LEHDGIRVRGTFRSVNETKRGPFEGLPRSVRRVRDAAIFECAAYELSQALGLGLVPPTVPRRIGDTPGSVQIWLEQAKTESELAEQSFPAVDVARWNLQKHRMYVFDALIANLDRNMGNLLMDRDGRLWFIDHTRAFAQTRALLGREKVTRCSRDLWQALLDFDEASVTERLEPYLWKGEIRALLSRRVALVAHIEELIAAKGEAAVLFDIDRER
jgi:hypothetical protein